MDQELFTGVRCGNLEAFRKLLDRGVDPNLRDRDPYENTLLVSASYYGYLEVVRELLNRGADPNLQDNRYGWTALIYAAIYGHLEVVKELLDRGADPNLPNKEGKTALMMAATYDYLEIAEELLKHEADPDLQDNYGWTALDSAKRRQDLANLIERYIIDPIMIDPNTGISNLAIVAANGPDYQLRWMIDNENVDINQQDLDGNTALIYAIVNRQKDHVGLLLDRGADPNLSNNAGGTPLDYANQLNQEKIERMLIDAGAQ